MSLALATEISSNSPLQNPAPRLVPEEKQRVQAVFNRIIPIVNAEIPSENNNLKEFVCPITRQPMEKLAVTNCGHLFEEANLKEWIEQSNSPICPECMQDLLVNTPVFKVQDLLDSWKKEERIPTFSNFKNNNPHLAQIHLNAARECAKEGKQEDAIRSYALAFKYTKDESAYSEMLQLFAKQGNKEKVSLGLLHLAQHFIQEDKVEAAIEALETHNTHNLSSQHVDHALLTLLTLYRAVGQIKEAEGVGARIDARIKEKALAETEASRAKRRAADRPYMQKAQIIFINLASHIADTEDRLERSLTFVNQFSPSVFDANDHEIATNIAEQTAQLARILLQARLSGSQDPDEKRAQTILAQICSPMTHISSEGVERALALVNECCPPVFDGLGNETTTNIAEQTAQLARTLLQARLSAIQALRSTMQVYDERLAQSILTQIGVHITDTREGVERALAFVNLCCPPASGEQYEEVTPNVGVVVAQQARTLLHARLAQIEAAYRATLIGKASALAEASASRVADAVRTVSSFVTNM